MCATRPGSVPQTRVAEAWMGAMLLVGGPLTIDSVLNTESQAWAVVCLGFGLACRGAIVAEVAALRAAWREKAR
ncbi:unnamed protein product [Pararhodospirillum photometricum DSM 122]|uniref:Uncharacterized protein n=1 Tax=Pararhodospirillum photometricum DSM 122 TaxID=1150469 RepID=H6SLP8_PARPM|nr:unnamed protein product [Pararhodospirillum photometricum DSM 122]